MIITIKEFGTGNIMQAESSGVALSLHSGIITINQHDDNSVQIRTIDGIAQLRIEANNQFVLTQIDNN